MLEKCFAILYNFTFVIVMIKKTQILLECHSHAAIIKLSSHLFPPTFMNKTRPVLKLSCLTGFAGKNV